MHGLDQRNYRVQQDHYALVPKSHVPRATFNRTHENKLTGPSGYLIPVLVDEVLPGDVHSGTVTLYARLSNLLFPLMDNATFEFQFFFVPCRIVWDNWKKFQGEQNNPTDSISYTIPTVNSSDGGFGPCTLWDYFGIPGIGQLDPGESIDVNVLPFRAYNLIYNEWYRDQNLQNSISISKGDGPDSNANYNLLRRNKKHDYFTSALPFPQKGNSVALPLNGLAPVGGLGIGTSHGGTVNVNVGQVGGSVVNWPNAFAADAPNLYIEENAAFPGTPNVYADLSQATGATINALRLAYQTQKLLETDARGGTRYVEQLKNRWGVTPQDSRLQRPEYIGGGIVNVQTAAIAQTSATEAGGTPLGGLAGQSTASGQAHFTCVGHEHGYIIGLMSLMTKPTYQQGLHRMWTRSTRYDFAMPEFTGLGEQAILNKEIYVTGFATDDDVFGYQERYAEYRFSNNRIAGLFRSTSTGTIDEWHLAQEFTSTPTLGSTFIQENAPFARVLAAGSTADNMQFLADMLFTIRSTRPLPAYGIPGGLL